MDMFIDLLNTISGLLASYTPLALFAWWPLPLISILHATRINLEYRRALKLAGHVGQPHAWLQGLSSTLTLSLGGTTISALLVGSHPGWLVSNVMIPAYMLVYAAVNHAPYDIIYTSLEMTATVLEPLLVVNDGVARSLAQIKSGIELARGRLGGDAWVAMLICGTIAATGGGVVGDLYQLSTPAWALRVPMAFRKTTVDIKTAFVGALVYVGTSSEVVLKLVPVFGHVMVAEGDKMVQVVRVLTLQQARALTVLVFVTGLLYKRYGVPWMTTAPVKTIKKKKDEKKE
jgi:hypothetical protein